MPRLAGVATSFLDLIKDDRRVDLRSAHDECCPDRSEAASKIEDKPHMRE